MIATDTIAERLIDLGYTGATLRTFPDNPPDVAIEGGRLEFINSQGTSLDSQQPEIEVLVKDLGRDFLDYIKRVNSIAFRNKVFELHCNGVWVMVVDPVLNEIVAEVSSNGHATKVTRWFHKGTESSDKKYFWWGMDLSAQLRGYYETKFQERIPLL